jgi:hypothetical protein
MRRGMERGKVRKQFVNCLAIHIRKGDVEQPSNVAAKYIMGTVRSRKVSNPLSEAAF